MYDWNIAVLAEHAHTGECGVRGPFGIYIETLSQRTGSLKIIAKEEKDGEHKLRFFLKNEKKSSVKTRSH